MTSAEREEQELVLRWLRRDAALLAERFRLPLRSIDAESPRVRRRYGICFEDGSIRIRLRHVGTGSLLKYSALVDTLCHELAHLRHFDHGAGFRALYQRILGYARRRGIYRPTPRRTQPSPGWWERGTSAGAIAAQDPRREAATRSDRPTRRRRRGEPGPDRRTTRPVQLDLFQ